MWNPVPSQLLLWLHGEQLSGGKALCSVAHETVSQINGGPFLQDLPHYIYVVSTVQGDIEESYNVDISKIYLYAETLIFFSRSFNILQNTNDPHGTVQEIALE